jgi:hypothetical protein
LQRAWLKVYVSCVSLYCFWTTTSTLHRYNGLLEYLLPSGSALHAARTICHSTVNSILATFKRRCWVLDVDDIQASTFPQTTTSLGSTQDLDWAEKTLSIHLKVPTPTSADPEIEELATTVPVLIAQTDVLPSNASATEASQTPSSSLIQPSLPAITVAEFNPSQNTTNTQASASELSTSILTIKQQATTVYVAQITPTTSQTLEPVATESESFLERSGITTPGSKANIAAIGLGAGCGVLVLVVVSVLAMWLLHRHQRSSSRVRRRDSIVKLERQSD